MGFHSHPIWSFNKDLNLSRPDFPTTPPLPFWGIAMDGGGWECESERVGAVLFSPGRWRRRWRQTAHCRCLKISGCLLVSLPKNTNLANLSSVVKYWYIDFTCYSNYMDHVVLLKSLAVAFWTWSSCARAVWLRQVKGNCRNQGGKICMHEWCVQSQRLMGKPVFPIWND